ncbi:hypothetical protein OL548_18880 [Lysinibacillus sp. MHQ-1]|nr:hypothetical protein OL548_18880 [Lysinibacillus sp. MHQ-1]
MGSLVACAVIAVAAPLVNVNNDTALDLTERIVVDHAAPAAKAVVNIEGKNHRSRKGWTELYVG